MHSFAGAYTTSMVPKSGWPVTGHSAVYSGHSWRITYSRRGLGLAKVTSLRDGRLGIDPSRDGRAAVRDAVGECARAPRTGSRPCGFGPCGHSRAHVAAGAEPVAPRGAGSTFGCSPPRAGVP